MTTPALNGHWEQWRLRWYWWAATGLGVGFVTGAGRLDLDVWVAALAALVVAVGLLLWERARKLAHEQKLRDLDWHARMLGASPLPGRHRRLHVPWISQHDTVGGV